MKGAIFDMDGLLLDTERIYQWAWHALASEMGVELPENFAAQITGKGEGQAKEIVQRYYHTQKPQEIIEEVKRRVTQREKDGVDPKPGALEILEGLREKGIRMAVASSSPEDMVRHNLGCCGMLDYFVEIVSGEEVPRERGKPHPDIFLLAARYLDLPPEDCWVFEDSLNGIQAGWAAGCQCVMIPDQAPPDETVQGKCQVFPTLLEAWRELSLQV